jgi:REP element-mobilizing transposase RayT
MRDREISCHERRQRRLPHWEEPGATYFVSCNLANRDALDLCEKRLAELIISALRHFDGTRYWLYDYTVMPDHVHCIIRLPARNGKSEALWRITQSIKGWLARRMNSMLGRKGQLWQHESHDHIIRNRQDYEEKANYIFWNPHRARLVADPAKWPWWGRGSGE